MTHQAIKAMLKTFVSRTCVGNIDVVEDELDGTEQDLDIAFFQQEVGVSPHRVLDAWSTRSSDFAFMESSVAPSESRLAIALMNVLRYSERLHQDIEHRQMLRGHDGFNAIPLELITLPAHLDEFSLVETLCEHPHLAALLPEFRRPLRTYIKQILDLVRDQSNRYVEHLVTTRLDEMLSHSDISSQGAVQTFEEAERQEVCLLKLPCKSASMNKWSGLFSDEWIERLVESDSTLREQLDALKLNADRQYAGLCERAVRPAHVVSLQGVHRDELWSEALRPYCLGEVSRVIKERRTHDIIDDVIACFEQLIDARRPKDQRVGSFWISEEDPELITVVFLTRDGRLLAQRDVSWRPQEPESIVDAFESIRIRTLTYPEELNQRYPEAISLLNTRYTMKSVISVALSRTQAPLNLNTAAYSALRVGQRYVAPLRYWIRADLVALTRHILSPPAWSCLERSGRLETLLSRLHDHCSERWLDLRRRRAQKRKEQEAHSDQAVKGASVYARGQRVEVRVIAHVEYYLDVVTLLDGRCGRIKINPTEQKRLPSFSQAGPQVGLVLTAMVLGEHPTTGELTLVLVSDPVTVDDHSTGVNDQNVDDGSNEIPSHKPSHESSSALKSEDRDTLSRLNALFSHSEAQVDDKNTSSRGQVKQGSDHQAMPKSTSNQVPRVAVSYRSP